MVAILNTPQNGFNLGCCVTDTIFGDALLLMDRATKDLGKEGALLTLSYVIPFSILDGRNFLVSGGGNGGVQYEFEVNYWIIQKDWLIHMAKSI